MRALDWIGRVAVLVLSTLATLAIVGSLVSVSGPRGAASQEAESNEVTIEFAPAAPASGPQRAASSGEAMDGDTPATPARVVDPRPHREIARWLRALTYAVLGLAGFIAVLAIVAMRATAHLGAIADRR